MTPEPTPPQPPVGVPVVDYDLHAGQGMSRDELFGQYEEMLARCPVSWTAHNGGHYIVTHNDSIRRCTRDWETFSSADGVMTPRYPLRMPPLEMDPPESRAWRDLVQADLSEHTVTANYSTQITEDVDALLDAIGERAEFDLMTEFAALLPMQTVSRVIGIRERAEELRALVTQLTQSAGDPAEASAVLARLGAILGEELKKREGKPPTDMLGRFLVASTDIDGLTFEKLILFVLSLLAAGTTTTISSLGATFQSLLIDPERRAAALSDPRALEHTVNEALRLSPPVVHFARTTTRDTEIEQISVPAGASVVMAYAAGNIDPEAFDTPLEFRLGRRGTPLTFGWGVHRCVGSHLGILQITISVQRMFERFPGLRLAVDPRDIVARVHAGLELSIPSMPVIVGRAPAS